MAFVRTVVIEFLAEHLVDRKNNQEWLIERLRGDLARDPNISDEELDGAKWEPIVDRLISIDREFQMFVDEKYDDRFTELTDPLVSRIKGGSSRKYYEAFRTIADELFMGEISWIRIVTFLVYSSELINRVLTELHSNDREKTFKMVSQVIKCTCTYFENHLLQWVEEQNGGWSNIIELTKGARERDGSGNAACRNIKQFVGVAAFAAVIGGLYLCSKLTVQ